MKRTGFIGVGNIANAIIKGSLAADVLKAENLIIYDIDKSKLVDFVSKGAVTANSLEELAEKSEVLFFSKKAGIPSA